MKKLLPRFAPLFAAPLFAAAVALVVPAATQAALPQGASAPQIVTQGALDGKPFAFNLRSALRRGPVVIYFYPKASPRVAHWKPMPLPRRQTSSRLLAPR